MQLRRMTANRIGRARAQPVSGSLGAASLTEDRQGRDDKVNKTSSVFCKFCYAQLLTRLAQLT